MKTLHSVAFAILAFAQTITGFAAFPIGSTNTVVADATKVDFVGFGVKIFDANTGDFYEEVYNRSLGYLSLRGRVESVRDIAYRSQADLKEAMEGKLQEILAGVLATEHSVPLEGKRLLVEYDGHKWAKLKSRDGYLTFSFSFATDNKFVATRDSAGNWVVPSTATNVDFVEAVLLNSGRVQAAPGVERVEVTVRDEYGHPVSVLSGTGDYNPEGITVYPDRHIFYLPRDLAVSGTNGDIRVWYADGREQLYSLKDGHDLITYRSPPAASPFRRSGLPSVTQDGKLSLPYEAEDWRRVRIERSLNPADPTSWKPLSGITFVPPVAPASIGSQYEPLHVRTALLPMDGPFAVYRLRDEEPVATQKQ